MGSITQDKIARRLGLSRQAVGFALGRDVSAHGRLRPETRQRILTAAQELGYVPHRAARSLASGKTDTIIMVTNTSFRYFYASEFLEELELALTPFGYYLNLELLYHAQNEDSVYQTFRPGHCDGVIKFGSDRSDHAQEQLTVIRRRGLPVVAVDNCQRPGVESVAVDLAEGTRLGTRHLFEQGYRRVAQIVDAIDGISRQTRLAGYRRALAEAGEPYDESLVIPWRADLNPGGLWARLAALSPRPTGLLCYNAELTVALLLEMRKHGVRVPEDMAIVSQGDSPLHVLVDVPLTCIDRNNRGVAAAVVARLRAQMRDPATPPQQILVKPTLVVRASSEKTIGSRRTAGAGNATAGNKKGSNQ